MSKALFDILDVDDQLKKIAKLELTVCDKETVMNEKIQNLKAKYEADTMTQRSQLNELRKELEAFCLLNKNDFSTSKTKKYLFGEVSFRTNPPKVMQLNKKYSVQTSLELIKRLFKNQFVRQKEEIDKESILAAYSSKSLDDQQLAGVGLKIDQEETFQYKIYWEAFEKK